MYIINNKKYEPIPEEIINNRRPEKVLAVVSVYNGGKWGKMERYAAEIAPQYFKNGKMKRSGFRVINRVETLQKGYRSQGAAQSESITAILKIL